jgi:pimeloyl-ACP methyl ester carboxylesterase
MTTCKSCLSPKRRYSSRDRQGGSGLYGTPSSHYRRASRSAYGPLRGHLYETYGLAGYGPDMALCRSRPDAQRRNPGKQTAHPRRTGRCSGAVATRLHAWAGNPPHAAPARLLAWRHDPCVRLRGKPDTVIPANCGELYQHALANAILQVIDRCGHSPALEKPEEFLPAVRALLAKE